MKEFDLLMIKPTKNGHENNLETLKHINSNEVVEALDSLIILKFFRSMLKFLENNI